MGATKAARMNAGWGWMASAVGLGLVLAWASATRPTSLPVWAPYDFSWVAFLGIVLPAIWYFRGLLRLADHERPGWGSVLAFGLGLALIWTALLTRFTYLSQHMFFLNRLQHLAMHHLGPFLVALAWPGRVLRRGMPSPVARLLDAALVGRVLRVVQQPVVAGVLFAGLVWFWLRPAVHFAAMISPTLYDVMNATMVVDGLLFWFLVLDPRPAPAATCSYPARLAVTLLVVFPQLLIGSQLTFTNRVVYSYYDLCGRLYPGISAINDQHIGGIVVWIPSAMMSAVAFMVIMNHIRRHEDRLDKVRSADIVVGGLVVSSSAWTGR